MKPVRNLILLLLAVSYFACTKESFTSDSSAVLKTSVDTLHFDTVFTSTGSTSQFIKIFNDNNKGVHISSVRLLGGSNSAFKINVDGLPGPQVNYVDVAADDSAYIYVTVSINPTAANLPFIVRDSIEITCNGNKRTVQLDAFGRNAHFFRNRIIKNSETWDNDLPYVILGGITVDTNAILTINKSCQVYSHADAPFIVNGSLQVNGEKYDSTRVVFTGDRLDEPYKDFPASYPGLIFNDVSRNNVINYAIIKNAYQGVVVVNPAAGTKLTLNETIIDNAYDIGLLGLNTSISGRNLLVSNCGKNIVLAAGGNYNFVHCTAATYSTNFIQHKDPVLTLTNYLNTYAGDLNASFRNCIFWGDANGIVKDEVVVLKQGATAFNVSFDQVLWRVQTAPANSTISGAINNQNPMFDSVNTSQKIYSFRLKQGSPAIDKGANAGVSSDLDGKPRPVGTKPDLGAYERQ
jgi:hypothetical protein